jgi:acyl dehydratase
MFHCYLDDFTPGSTFETEGKTLSEAEILDFALKYDPQPFHMDVEAAKDGPFGGLIASGIHTLAIGLRMMLQAQVFAPGASLGSPGLDELRWVKPVRPGDTLRLTGETIETRPSRSKPDRGVLRYKMTVLNQRDEAVMTMIGNQILKRPPSAIEI